MTTAFTDALRRQWTGFEQNLALYDMLAATVVAMIVTHVVTYFGADSSWWQVPSRILLPVFLIPLGFNAGHRVDRALFLWSAALIMEQQILLTPYFAVSLLPLPLLLSIALVRLLIEPVMRFATESAPRFWVLAAALFALAPASEKYSEYIGLVALFAVAGWLVRNAGDIKTVKPRDYFAALFVYYHCYGHFLYFHDTPLRLVVVLAFSAAVFYLLYHLRTRVLVSVKRRPKDAIEKFCSFLGHKSLEIYALHLLIIQAAIFLAIR